MAAQTDFWGEIAPAAVRTPLAILREQAALLGAKTKNLIEATVATSVNGPQFQHRFNLVVPSLGNYTYELFWVTHGIEMYPIIVPLALPKDRELTTEQEFTEWLRGKLSSDATKKIIVNLLAQATS
jgi:hypothetical protein